MSASETRSRPDHAECAECGAIAQPGRSFCDACGAFLSWAEGPDTGAAEAGPAGPAGPAATERTSPGRTPSETVTPAAEATAAGSAAESKSSAAESQSPAAVAPTAPKATAAKAAPKDQGPGPAQEPDTTELPPVSLADLIATERAQALLVPVPESTPADPGVAPVLPGRPQENGPRVRAAVEEQPLDGIACAWCATVNPPERHFCRRCATRFSASAPEKGPRPWWRRLLDFRGREAPWAGQRPRLRRGPWQLVRWIVAGALVVTLLVTGLMWAGPAATAVSDHFAHRVPIDPVAMTASHSFAGHGPELTIDKVSNSWWGSGYSGEPVDASTWLEAEFAEPVHLLDVVITPGTGPQPSEQLAQARPRGVDLVATGSDGRTSTTHLELAADGPQTFSLHLDHVVKARLVIRSAYGTGPDKQVAVAEVEFFGTAPTAH